MNEEISRSSIFRRMMQEKAKTAEQQTTQLEKIQKIYAKRAQTQQGQEKSYRERTRRIKNICLCGAGKNPLTTQKICRVEELSKTSITRKASKY